MVVVPFEVERVIFQCVDGPVQTSRGLFIRMIQEGNIFDKMLVKQDKLIEPVINNTLTIHFLRNYNVKAKAVCALLYSLRNNDFKYAYKYRATFERIGGFKCIDKFHRRKLMTPTNGTN